jgi:hypothetical protein
MSEIKINPLHGLINNQPRKTAPRPKWMCKHKDAVLLDSANCIYRCILCNPGIEIIRVIPNVPLTKTSPKKVTVSPETSCSSPKPGFS